MPVLRLEGVTRVYPGVSPTHALRGIDLEIDGGEFLAIEGPSGGGKSTLLNIIGLLDTPTAGSYALDGINASALSRLQRAQVRSAQFAFIFQGFHLLDRRPVVDSVELGLLYRGIDAVHRRHVALQALAEVGLSHRAHHLAGSLSGGERQRVAIARAIASKSPVVVADEPTGNLDSDNSDKIVDALSGLHRSGATVVLVTHSPHVASSASVRIEIRDGELAHHSGSADRPVEDSPSGSNSVDALTTAQLGTASTERWRDLIVDAGRSIRSRMSRTIGLAITVGIGVALAIGTLGVSASANAQVSAAFDAHANRDVSVALDPEQLAGQRPEERMSIPDRLSALKGVEAVGTVDDIGSTSVETTSAREPVDADAFGVSGDFAQAARLSIDWVPGHSHELAEGEVLIGSGLAGRMEIGPLEGGPIVVANDSPETVVGVITASPRLPEMLGGFVTGAPENFGQSSSSRVLILTSVGAAQQVARQARYVVDPYDPEAVRVEAPTDPSTLRSHVQSEIQITLFVITGITIIGSIAGLTTAMMMMVLERKGEFGLRRAIGAQTKHISRLVFAESTMIGLLGGVIGLVVGLAGILIVTIIQRWTPVFDLALAPAAIAGGVLVGAVGGLIAARRAAKIEPHEALRS